MSASENTAKYKIMFQFMKALNFPTMYSAGHLAYLRMFEIHAALTQKIKFLIELRSVMVSRLEPMRQLFVELHSEIMHLLVPVP
ncbi:hypothetical protein TH24_21110 [Thalassospira xiamenensis]|nr:hypothetical protein TH24_21110 [Thalassospira xiamenensis]